MMSWYCSAHTGNEVSSCMTECPCVGLEEAERFVVFVSFLGSFDACLRMVVLKA